MTDEPMQVPQWDQQPDKIKAHYSSLTLHRKCPQAWQYRYVQGLSKPIDGPAPELHFGTWWGLMTGAEALTRGRALDSLLFDPRSLKSVDGGPRFDQRTMVVKDVLQASVDWWKEQDSDTKDVWIEKLGAPLPNRLRDTYLRWRDEWAEDRKNEVPLGTEVFWNRRLPRPGADASWENGEGVTFESLPPIELIGYIDQLYYDSERNITVVRDDKSSKSLGMQSSLDDMMDSQLQLYPWGINQKLHEMGHQPATAVAYDRVKSTAGSKPALTASGGLSKATTSYDLQTYLDWAKGPEGEGIPWGEDGAYFVSGPRKGKPKFGVYQAEDEVIKRLSEESHRRQFFQRTLVPANRNLVQAHLRAAIDSATDIARTQRRLQATGEAPRNLTRGNCQFCDYQKLCRAQMAGGADGDYDLREHSLVSRDGRVEINTLVKAGAQP